MNTLLLTLLCLSPVVADDLPKALSVRVGIGWSEESVVFGTFMESRRLPVTQLELRYPIKRLTLQLDAETRLGSKSLAGVAGATFGELKTVLIGQRYTYNIGKGWSLEFAHSSDHVQGKAPGNLFGDVNQRNRIVLWKELR